MSEQQPPAGTPEYLDSGSGDSWSPAPDESEAPAGRRSRRTTWLVGGGAVALLAVGAGAWAAVSFFSQGSQPAEALPSTTVAYASIDLDPSGSQKIDAFRTLNKFPEFKDGVGVNSVDELRRELGRRLISDSGCDGLDYGRDVDPWLGNRMAGAVVPLGDGPHLVVVVQVTDEDQARSGIAKIDDCTDTGDDGVVVKDGWAILAESQKVADGVVAATGDGTLADDATYRKWTEAVGDAGVINAYASPEAGRVLSEEIGGFFGGDLSAVESSSSEVTTELSAYHASGADDADDPFTQALSGFEGGAATLRFTGDGVELAAAGDGSSRQLADLTGTTGGELVRRLPDDTAAAAGISLPEGWLSRQVDGLSLLFGGGLSGDELYRQMSQETGLDAPDDIETLLGSGFALSVGDDIDLADLEYTDDGVGVPIAATVKGDPKAIGPILDKLRARAGDLPILESDSSGDLAVIGPTADYRRHVLDGGSLGDDDAFSSVVPDAEHASMVLFVDVDAFEPALKKLVSGDDSGDIENLIPLRAVGLSTWTDDGVARFSVKLTTN